jgi:hypothetical protein
LSIIYSTIPYKEISLKIPKQWGLEGFWAGDPSEVLREWCSAGGGVGMEALCPSPGTLPYTSLLFGVSWVVSFIINQ